MSDGELGPSVTGAVRLLKSIYRDMRLLIAALDREMADSGWHPVGPKNVSEGLGNSLGSESWVMDTLHRHYLPTSDAGSTRMIFVCIHLDPFPPLTEPMCLGCVLQFAAPTTGVEAYEQWTTTESAYQAVAGQTGLVRLPPNAVRELAATATAAAAVVTPLCRLRDTADVRRQLVEPVLSHLVGEQAVESLTERPAGSGGIPLHTSQSAPASPSTRA